jgi:spoIIIJ-associated protein
MEGIEIEGKTIDDAIEKACGKFQVPRDKLNIEIIAEGNPGFLGLGAKKARVRAGLLSIDMTLDTVFSPSEISDSTSMERFVAAVPQEKADDGGAKSTVPSPKTHPTAHSGATRPTTKKPPSSEPRTAVKPYPVTTEEGKPAAERAKRLLEGLLSRMQISSPVSVEETNEAIILNIQGEGSGLLIGKRGQNLDALQYILNKAIHHSANGNKMIVIDTEEYRKRREESLIALARRLGEKVKQTKKPVTVGHMNAHDRRIIHVAIQNDETLTTKSRGEGEYRKIVIIPARCAPNQAGA